MVKLNFTLIQYTKNYRFILFFWFGLASADDGCLVKPGFISGLTANYLVLAEANTRPATIGGREKERAEPDFSGRLILMAGGVRYQAINWGKAQGLEQNGGYIAAIDEKSGEQKWLVRVYPVYYDSHKEADKQDVFIRKLAWGGSNQEIIIENELGEIFALDLINLKVSKKGN